MLKYLVKDEKGSIFIGTYLIMVVILISILILDLSITYSEINLNQLNSKNFNYIINDYQTNILILSYGVLGNLSEQVMKIGFL
jgi:hypothetical protein